MIALFANQKKYFLNLSNTHLHIYYCVLQYRWPGASGLPFAFRGSGAGDLDKEWNLHPVLMIAGFIYCMGQGKIFC